MALTMAMTFAIIPVHGIQANEGADIIHMNYSSQITGKKVTVDVEYEDKMLTNDSTQYNHKLALVSSLLAAGAYGTQNDSQIRVGNYKAMGIKEEDIEDHYNPDYKNDGKDQSGYSFAIKHTIVNGVDVPIAYIVTRGTYSNAEWISNMNVNDANRGWSWDDMHEGFNNASKLIMKNFVKFLSDKNISQENVKILICGHSRGAAIANVLGGDIDNHKDGLKFVKENVHVYTFATPNTTNKSLSEKDYNNIYNIVNPEDIVTLVPFDDILWGYGRYGITKVLPTKSNHPFAYADLYNKMNVYFKGMTGCNYRNFKLGLLLPTSVWEISTTIMLGVRGYYGIGPFSAHDFIIDQVFSGDAEETPSNDAVFHMITAIPVIKEAVNAGESGGYAQQVFIHMHAIDTYISWLRSGSDSEIYDSNAGYRQMEVKADVNVEVRDENGMLVAEVKDGIVNQDLVDKYLPACIYANEYTMEEGNPLTMQSKDGSEKIIIQIPNDFQGNVYFNGVLANNDVVIKAFTNHMNPDTVVHLTLEGNNEIEFKANDSIQNLQVTK